MRRLFLGGTATVLLSVGMFGVVTPIASAKDHTYKHHAMSSFNQNFFSNKNFNWNEFGDGRSIPVSVAVNEIVNWTNMINPKILSAESSLSSSLQYAISHYAQSGSNQVFTQQEQSLIAQLQQYTGQFPSLQSNTQMLSSISEIQGVLHNLKGLISQSENDMGLGNQWTQGENWLQKSESRYSVLYQNVEKWVSVLQGGSADGRKSALHRAEGTFKNYFNFSDRFLQQIGTWQSRLNQSGAGSAPSGNPAPVPTSISASLSTYAISSTSVQAGQGVTIAGILKNNSGAPVSNATVVLSFDGQTQSQVSSYNGSYQFSFTPTKAVLNGSVVVQSEGITISPTVANLTVVPSAQMKFAVVSPASLNANANGVYTLTYELTDVYGNPIPNVRVDFSLAESPLYSEANPETNEWSGQLSTSYGITNSSGEVSVNYTAPSVADQDRDMSVTVTATPEIGGLSNVQNLIYY